MEKQRPTLNTLLVKQAVNCGDHGQDITTAVEPQEDETVRQFAERILTETASWGPTAEVVTKDDWYVVLRLVKPPEGEPTAVKAAF